MKKFHLIAVLLISTIITHAQTGLTFGLGGQYSSIWIQNQNNYEMTEMDYEYKYGSTAGLTLGYNWATNFGMQLEITYSQNGQLYEDIMRELSEVENPENPNAKIKVLTTRDIDLNYIQVPVFFKMQQGELKDAIKYHFMPGIVFGYLLSADQVYTADVNGDDNMITIPPKQAPQAFVPEFNIKSETVAMEDYFQTFNFGAMLDLGADVYLNDKTYLTPSFRGFYGLTDINSPPTRELAPGQVENPYKASHIFYIGIHLGISWYFENAVIEGGE